MGPDRGWYPVADVVLHPILLPVPCRTSRDETWQDVLRDGKVVAVTVPVGCYDFFGWITGESDTSASGYTCFKKSQATIATVREGSVQFDN